MRRMLFVLVSCLVFPAGLVAAADEIDPLAKFAEPVKPFLTSDTVFWAQVSVVDLSAFRLSETVEGIFDPEAWKIVKGKLTAQKDQPLQKGLDAWESAVHGPFQRGGGTRVHMFMRGNGQAHLIAPHNQTVAADDLKAWLTGVLANKAKVTDLGTALIATQGEAADIKMGDPLAHIPFAKALAQSGCDRTSRLEATFVVMPNKASREMALAMLAGSLKDDNAAAAPVKQLLTTLITRSEWIAGYVQTGYKPEISITVKMSGPEGAQALKKQYDAVLDKAATAAVLLDVKDKASQEWAALFGKHGKGKPAEEGLTRYEFAQALTAAAHLDGPEGSHVLLHLSTGDIQVSTTVVLAALVQFAKELGGVAGDAGTAWIKLFGAE